MRSAIVSGVKEIQMADCRNDQKSWRSYAGSAAYVDSTCANLAMVRPMAFFVFQIMRFWLKLRIGRQWGCGYSQLCCPVLDGTSFSSRFQALLERDDKDAENREPATRDDERNSLIARVTHKRYELRTYPTY
jgi:hypothetical protein